jgi:hypothetical protein
VRGGLEETMGKRGMGWMLAMGALSGAAGCGAADDGDEEPVEVGEAEQALSANPGICHHGMSTTLKKLHPASDFPYPGGAIPAWFSCTLDQVPELMEYVCKTDPIVCSFLKDVAAGHGRLQCTKYTDSTGKKRACVDIVDKYADGSLLDGNPQAAGGYYRNFMILLARDEPGSADREHWDTQIPLWPDPPVELSVAGHYYEPSAAVGGIFFSKTPPGGVRRVRLLKADPRECTHCGPYDGPSYGHISNPADLTTWFPDFTPSSCRFDIKPPDPYGNHTFHVLSQTECNAEAVWRVTGH